ncbi:MAG: hypothetical protein COC19_00820 [SAR86 cluster bacterium]|uniref:Uncharacterized protein n=1 Tax=SAR86 cluster bacterium TaxID=2030880 RepID=A0A2A4MTM8_9GAMM|nr:MAG: hypothetical protein COC19_00820 [SAR86 cluster bacterium]
MSILVQAYLSAEDPLSRELIFDKLVASINDDNYMDILADLESEPEALDLEISMVIEAITTPERLELLPIIHKMRRRTQDIYVIEDLDDALKKLGQS